MRQFRRQFRGGFRLVTFPRFSHIASTLVCGPSAATPLFPPLFVPSPAGRRNRGFLAGVVLRAIGTTGRAELPAGDRNPLDFGDASPRGSHTVGMVGVFPRFLTQAIGRAVAGAGVTWREFGAIRAYFEPGASPRGREWMGVGADPGVFGRGGMGVSRGGISLSSVPRGR